MEHKLMRALYSLFCPFAVGRPKDIQASSLSAIRLYVGEDWKEKVAEMMRRAPIILLRVSDSDNFFWEFEQCVINEYIGKSIFWISEKEQYDIFHKRVGRCYNLKLPSIEEVTDNSLVYKSDENFNVLNLETKSSYIEFVHNYNEQHHLTQHYSDYFAGRDCSLIKQFFTWERNPDMIGNAQSWSWTAFLFPELYIITQRFPNRGWFYFSFVLLSCLGVGGIVMEWAIRIPLMFYMGRNGKKMMWLSEKWESISYFEEMHKKNNLKIALWAICMIICLIFVILV